MTDTRFINEYVYVYVLPFQIFSMNEKLDVFYRGDSEKHVQTCFVCVEVTALHVRSDAAFIKVIWEGIFSVKILRETFVVKGEVCIRERERVSDVVFIF